MGKLFSENGVRYTHNAKDGQEANFASFEYRWEHLETGNAGIKTVYCQNYADFCKLLAKWNQSGYFVYRLPYSQ